MSATEAQEPHDTDNNENALKKGIRDNAEKNRDNLRLLVEKYAEKGEIDIAELLKYYGISSSQPHLDLLLEIQKRLFVYNNIMEDIKKVSIEDIRNRDDNAASDIRHKYETLGLVDKGRFPKTKLLDLTKWASKKIEVLGKGLLKLLTDYAQALLLELRLEHGTTAVLQVQLGMSWTVTMGVEHSVGFSKLSAPEVSK